MFLELVAGLAVLGAIAVTALLWRHYAKRAQYHRELAGRRADLTADHEPEQLRQVVADVAARVTSYCGGTAEVVAFPA